MSLSWNYVSKPKRQGVQAARDLLQKAQFDVDEWNQLESRYNDMLKLKGGDDLIELQKVIDCLENRFKVLTDEASVDELYEENKLISKEEFISVMRWKFSIGKDRSKFLMKVSYILFINFYLALFISFEFYF